MWFKVNMHKCLFLSYFKDTFSPESLCTLISTPHSMVRTSPYMRVRSGTRYVNLDKYLSNCNFPTFLWPGLNWSRMRSGIACEPEPVRTGTRFGPNRIEPSMGYRLLRQFHVKLHFSTFYEPE